MAQSNRTDSFYPFQSERNAIIYASPSKFYPRAQTYWKRKRIRRTSAFRERVVPLLDPVDMEHAKGQVGVERIVRPVAPHQLDFRHAHMQGTRAWQVIWLLLRYMEEGYGPFSIYQPTVARIAEKLWMLVWYDSRAGQWVLDVRDEERLKVFATGVRVLIY